MRTSIITVFFNLGLLIASVAQNDFIAGDYGTFEAEGSDLEIIQFNSLHNPQYGSINRSSNQKKDGNYSLRIVQSIPPSGLSRTYTMLPFQDNLPGTMQGTPFSIWLYIPRSENLTLPSTMTNFLELWSVSGGFTRCGSEPISLVYDQWIHINPVLTAAGNNVTFVFSNSGMPGGANVVYYIDKIEARIPQPLELTGNVSGNSISLNTPPMGGFQPYAGPWIYNHYYTYNWSDGVVGSTTRSNLPYGSYSVTVVHRVGTSGGPSSQCSVHKSISFAIIDPSQIVPLCETKIPISTSGEFKLDKHSGLVVFDREDNCTPPINLGCIEGQPERPLLSNVVAATATTFSDIWNFEFTGYQPHSANDYENGQRGKWRPKATYAFNSAIDYQGNDKNYSAGKFTLSHFNWQHPESSTKSGWLLANRVEKYSPSGDPVEEVNALEIASAAKFGYGGSVPYLVVQNAPYSGVMFESFENVYGSNSLEDNLQLVGGFRVTSAHSGKHAFRLTSQFKSRAISSGGKNIQVRFWASGDVLPGHITITAGTGSSATPIAQIAQSGGWSLWESTVTPGSDNVFIFITKSGGGTIYIDDLRIQPVDAEMTCYVYDPRTLRLLTVFDDQHFGLYYQYNDEGKLVRKQLETERGIKTIQETQYNLPTQAKNASGN